jgi:hypothetical protein
MDQERIEFRFRNIHVSNENQVLLGNNINGETYDFEIRRWSNEELKQNIVAAKPFARIGSRGVFELLEQKIKDNRDNYEISKKQLEKCGICIRCAKNLKQNARSFDAIPHIYYWCLDHLITEIQLAREFSESINVLVKFPSSDKERTNYKGRLFISFRDNKAQISNDEKIIIGVSDYKLSDFDNDYQTEYFKKMIYIIDKIEDLVGEYQAILIGRWVCKNKLLGRECQSDSKDRPTKTFTSLTSPNGAPTWYEDHSTSRGGRIKIGELCYACFLHKVERKRY